MGLGVGDVEGRVEVVVEDGVTTAEVESATEEVDVMTGVLCVTTGVLGATSEEVEAMTEVLCVMTGVLCVMTGVLYVTTGVLEATSGILVITKGKVKYVMHLELLGLSDSCMAIQMTPSHLHVLYVIVLCAGELGKN